MKESVMDSTWYVVADASRAKIFSVSKGKLKLIKQLYHEESRLKRSALITDKVGLFRNGHGGGGDFVGADTKLVEKETFAKELVDFLEEARKTNRFESIVWISLSRFYGLASKHINPSLQRCIFQHIDKNYLELDRRKLTDLITTEQWWHWQAA